VPETVVVVSFCSTLCIVSLSLVSVRQLCNACYFGLLLGVLDFVGWGLILFTYFITVLFGYISI
jgi:hypothetical protein